MPETRKATKLNEDLHKELASLDGTISDNLDDAVRLFLAERGHRQKVLVPEHLLLRLDDNYAWDEHMALALNLYLAVIEAGHDPMWAAKTLAAAKQLTEMELYMKGGDGNFSRVVIL